MKTFHILVLMITLALLSFAPLGPSLAQTYQIDDLGDLSPTTPIWQWEVSSAVLPADLAFSLCPLPDVGDPRDPDASQVFLSWVISNGADPDQGQRIMSCASSELGTHLCDATTDTLQDLSGLGICSATTSPNYVPTSNDNVMVRLGDGRIVQIVQTIKLNCPPTTPAPAAEDREQVAYVVRVSDDCGRNWETSVLDADQILDLEGNLLSPRLKNFDRVEAYVDPWSDHILMTAQTGSNPMGGTDKTAYLHAPPIGHDLVPQWELLFTDGVPAVPTVMTSLPHGNGSRVYWFNCEPTVRVVPTGNFNHYYPTLYFADDPWSSATTGNMPPNEIPLAPLLALSDGVDNDNDGMTDEADEANAIGDYECLFLHSKCRMCDVVSADPACPPFEYECCGCSPADSNIHNVIGNNAIARLPRDGFSDRIRIAYPQLTIVDGNYYQTLRIADFRLSPGGSIEVIGNEVIDKATAPEPAGSSRASVFYPSIIQVDKSTDDDPYAATQLLRWTEFDNSGHGIDIFKSWDPVNQWNPEEELDRWNCSGECSSGDYQYGAFVDTLDACTHQFFVPWGVEVKKTHGAMVTTSFDREPPVFDFVPPAQTASCDSVPQPAVPLASDNCDPAPKVDPEPEEERIDGTCIDNYQLIRTWEASDNAGLISSTKQTIDVVDTTPPVLDAVPSYQTVECDAVPPPPDLSATDNCDVSPSVAFQETRTDGSCSASYDLSRTWTALDRCGNETTHTHFVSVRDTTPPVVESGANDLYSLWSPNHKFVRFTRDDFSPTLADNCSGSQTWRFADCISDQPDDADGDGTTSNDCVISQDGQWLQVRAERDARNPAGRRYSVSIFATDECGNESASVIIGNIHVPHNRPEGR